VLGLVDPLEVVMGGIGRGRGARAVGEGTEGTGVIGVIAGVIEEEMTGAWLRPSIPPMAAHMAEVMEMERIRVMDGMREVGGEVLLEEKVRVRK
jgi:hypothetical protein